MKVTTDGCLFGAWCAENVHEFIHSSLSEDGFTCSPAHLLDVGTGTGLLSLLVAQKNDVLIDAIEIDKEAAEQAKENIAASPWKEKINIIHADVLQWKTETKYDCILSNPPFYEKEIKSGKQIKNVAHHDEGLKFSPLFHFIKNHLTKNGCFFLLLPAKREAEMEMLLKRHELFPHKKVYVKQSFLHQPFRLIIQGANKKADKIFTEEIVIKNHQQYSDAFIALLKDYYCICEAKTQK